MFKVIAVGVREKEFGMYRQINTEEFGYEITMYPMDHDIRDPEIYKGGYDAVISGNNTTVLNDAYFAMLEENHIRVFIIKMTGYNQIDLDAAKAHNVMIANIEAYSPNAIAELAVGMAMALNRDFSAYAAKAEALDFTQIPEYPKEIRDCKVGILGTGHIGMVTASLYKALGAEVYGFDRFEKEENKAVLTYTTMEEIFRTCDIVSIHLAYIYGQNDRMINAEVLSHAQKDLILVNAARGELVDLQAVVDALKEGRIRAFGADVVEHEKQIFGRKVEEITNDTLKELYALKDRILITPHIGANTVRARENQIRIALKEAKSLCDTGEAPFRII